MCVSASDSEHLAQMSGVSTPDIEPVVKPERGWWGKDGKPIRAVGDNSRVNLPGIPIPFCPPGPATWPPAGQYIVTTWLEFALWEPRWHEMYVPPR